MDMDRRIKEWHHDVHYETRKARQVKARRSRTGKSERFRQITEVSISTGENNGRIPMKINIPLIGNQ